MIIYAVQWTVIIRLVYMTYDFFVIFESPRALGCSVMSIATLLL